MAFTFSQYQPSRPNEYPLNDFIGKILSGYSDTTKARYLQPTLEEELQKAKLFNKWYEPNMQSQIGLRGAQAGQARAHTGLLGEQTRAAHMSNEYLPDKLKAQLEAQQLAAAQNRMFNDMLRQRLTGKQAIENTQPDISEYTPGLGEAPFSQDMAQSKREVAQKPSMQQAISQTLSPPEISNDDIINKKFFGLDTYTPKYKAYIDAVSRNQKIQSEEEKAFRSGLGKDKAKFYDESIKAYNALGNQDLALEELQSAVEGNPEFRNVVGPLNRPLSSWFGTPEQKKLLGNLESSSGEIALQVAPSLKGAFTGRDQALIGQIKASPRDPADVFIGKLAAQRLINSVLRERAKLQSQFIEQGDTQLSASEKAAKLTPLSQYKSSVDSLINPKNSFKEPDATKHLSNEQLLKIAGLK